MIYSQGRFLYPGIGFYSDKDMDLMCQFYCAYVNIIRVYLVQCSSVLCKTMGLSIFNRMEITLDIIP